MPALAGDADRLLLDTGPFLRFGEAQQLGALLAWLTGHDDALVVQQVFNELWGLANNGQTGLTPWLNAPPSGRPGKLLLDTSLTQEVADVRNALSSPDDLLGKNLGEAATIVAGLHHGPALLVMDDRDGKKYARSKGLQTITTAQLAAELAARRVIVPKFALAVFDCATPPELAGQELKARFRATVAEALSAGAEAPDPPG